MKNQKTSKSRKTTKNTTTKSTDTKVAKNVYMRPSGTYRVRKTINGTKIDVSFKSKTKAISYAKSL